MLTVAQLSNSISPITKEMGLMEVKHQPRSNSLSVAGPGVQGKCAQLRFPAQVPSTVLSATGETPDLPDGGGGE